MKRKTLRAALGVLLLALSRLRDADPDRASTETLVALAQKARELARVVHRIPVTTRHTA